MDYCFYVLCILQKYLAYCGVFFFLIYFVLLKFLYYIYINKIRKHMKNTQNYFEEAYKVYHSKENQKKDGELKASARKKFDKLVLKYIHSIDVIPNEINNFIY